MRQIFLIIVILFSFDGFASDVLKLTGSSNLNFSYANQTQDNSSNVNNDSQLFLRLQNIVNDKLKVGLIAKGQYIVRSNASNLEPNLDKAFLFLRHKKLARVEFGNVEAVNQKMKIGGFSVAKGGGGINGKYLENINLNHNFILLAQSPIGHGLNYRNNNLANRNINDSSYRLLQDNSFDGVEDATKINIVTNRFSGFKFGLSYTPNIQDQGLTNVSYFSYDNNQNIKNIFSFALNYLQNFDNLSLELSATSELGDAKYDLYSPNSNDLFAYDLGFIVKYFGFELAASYGSWQDSLRQEDKINLCQNCANPNYFTGGISYKIGPISTSITSLNSNYYDNKFSAISYDLGYKLTKDLMTYFEITRFEFKKSNYGIYSFDNNSSNQGYVAMVGTLINF